MIAILIISITPLFITPILGYVYTSSVLRDKIVALTNQNLEAVSEGVNQVIDDIIIASNVVVLDEEIVSILANPSQGVSEQINNKKSVESKLQNMQASNLYPYNVETTLLDFKGNSFNTGFQELNSYEEIVQQPWFEEAISKNGYFLWSGSSIEVPDYTNGITMIRLVKEDYYYAVGVLMIHVYPEKKVKNLLVREEEVGSTSRYLIDSFGQVILSSDTHTEIDVDEALDKLGNETAVITQYNGQKVIISKNTIYKPGWSVLQIVSYESIMTDVSGYRDLMMVTNIVFIMIMLVAAYFVSKNVTKAISSLSFFIGKVTEGNFNVKSDISGSYEVNQLSNSFNKMVDRIEELIHQVAYETEQKQQTKIDALQAQINPHFLLNTLNGIKWLCVIENAKTAEKMLISLGYLLENTLGKYDELIPIDEEIKCLESYCALQKMRYGKTFEVHYEVSDALGAIKIPVLLLQPIVENSILHAFEDREEMGEINISIQEVADGIEIVIQDNGIGMQEEQIGQLMSLYPKKNKYSSMGMRNVKERIKLYYGDCCDMVVESEWGVGTRTVLTLKKEIKTRRSLDESLDC